jgi:CubicO group peptidase (beta-lactamase class C family)
MKKIFLSVFLSAACLQFISCQTKTTDAKLDTLMSAYTRMYKFNGAVLVAQNGKIILEKGYGYRNANDKIPHDASSVFQIGSVTKQFTAAVILKLQEQKKLNIQDKLSKYFPAYPKGDSITIEHLLTHTSGIHSYTDDENFMENEVTKPSGREKMIALFKDKPLHFSPGSKWEYSNSAYSLLGYIIEDVTHMPYEKAVRQYIFTPLGMTHSGFDFTHLSTSAKSTGYFQLNDKTALVAPVVDSSVSYSAGSIYSTVGDLYQWSKGLNENKIISAATKEKAFTPVKNHYGYGLFIDSLWGKRRISHGGGIHGFNSSLVMIPSDDICVVLLNNAPNPALKAITDNILAILYDKPYELPKAPVETTVDAAILTQYVGEYELAPNFTITISVKEGSLRAQATAQPEFPLFPEKTDRFFLKVVDAQLEFKRDEKGIVNGLVLFQGGQEVPGKKIK